MKLKELRHDILAETRQKLLLEPQIRFLFSRGVDSFHQKSWKYRHLFFLRNFNFEHRSSMDIQGFHEIEFHKQTSSIKLSREKYILLHLQPNKQMLFNIKPNLKLSVVSQNSKSPNIMSTLSSTNQQGWPENGPKPPASLSKKCHQTSSSLASFGVHIRKIPSPNKQLLMILLGNNHCSKIRSQNFCKKEVDRNETESVSTCFEWQRKGQYVAMWWCKHSFAHKRKYNATHKVSISY